MTWQRGSQQTKLSKLNVLTSRLIRLITYKKLEECQQRLQDRGINCNVLDNFEIPLPSKENNRNEPFLVKVIPNNESTF